MPETKWKTPYLPFLCIVRKENGKAKENPMKTKGEKKSLMENLKGKSQRRKQLY